MIKRLTKKTPKNGFIMFHQRETLGLKWFEI